MKQENLKNIKDASEYEAYTSRFLQPWDEMFVRRCSALNPCPNGPGRLLDVGTGTAVLLERLKETPSFNRFSFEGLDYYEDNVTEARLKFSRLGYSDSIFMLQGDAHSLPYPDDTFDMVVSRATLHHLVNPVAALAEKYRVLRSGGICLVHDMRRDAPQDVLDYFNGLRREANYPPTVVQEKYTLAEVRSFLAEAGLAAHATVAAAEEGMAALGFEIVIRK